MRIISLLIAFCFSLNVMASTGTVQELEKALDDYHYSLSVEWDQKDQAFYDSKTKEFFSKMESMIKNDGLTQEQVLTLVSKKVNNPKVVESLKLKAALMGKAASAEELAKMIKDSTDDMYAQGASWNGQVIVPVVIGLLVVAAISYSIWWGATHECVAYEQQYVCNTYNNCSYSGGYYDPYYGGGYYGGSYCYGGSYTTCGWADVCTEYAKK
jgi:hypothetical protein